MKVRLRQLANLRPSKVVIIILVILILILTSILIGINSELNNHDDVVAHATADRSFVRIGSIIQFSSNDSKGDIIDYLWSFGDGTESEEMNPQYLYDQAGIFNVTLTVFGKNGVEDNTTIQVGVQNEDYQKKLTSDRDRYISQNGKSGPAVYGILGPNSGNPQVIIQGTISGAIGEFELEVSVEAEMQWLNEFYVEPITARGETLTFDILISPDDIPEKSQGTSCLIRLVFWTFTGRYGDVDLTMTVGFPVDTIS